MASDTTEKNGMDVKEIDLKQLWQKELVARLRHPGPTRELLESIATEPGAPYDLLFYAAFSERILSVMRREGKETDGFARMQQSFRESVEKVRAIVMRAGEQGFTRSVQYTELSPGGMANMMELIQDLSVVKDWQNRED